MDSREECDQIQESRDTFIDWAKDWQMQFNMRKYKMMLGKNTAIDKDYIMQRAVLERVIQEKDMGVVACSRQTVHC